MPDLDSFIITAKNQENLSTGAKRKKGRKDKDSIEEEVMPTGGTASRRGRKIQEKIETASIKRGEYEVPQGLEPKIVYPNKKYNVSTKDWLTFCSRRGMSSLRIGNNNSLRHGMCVAIGVSRTSIGYMGVSSLKVC